MANAHKRGSAVLRIKINGICQTAENAMKEAVVRAFQNLLTESGDWRPNCEGLEFNVLRIEEVAGLEIPFSKKKIYVALSNLCGDKIPRLNGFSMAFWQAKWELGKEEVMGLFQGVL